MRDWRPAVFLGGNDRLDIGLGEFLADGIGVIASVGEQRLYPLRQHPEQRPEALHVMRLAGRQDEAERPALSVAPRVELGGEPATRPPERLGVLNPFFSPTAQ